MSGLPFLEAGDYSAAEPQEMEVQFRCDSWKEELA